MADREIQDRPGHQERYHAGGYGNRDRHCGDHGSCRHPSIEHDKNNLCRFQFPCGKRQLIARIDPATFKSQVQQAQANLFAAQAYVEKAVVSLDDAKRMFYLNREFLTHKAENLFFQS